MGFDIYIVGACDGNCIFSFDSFKLAIRCEHQGKLNVFVCLYNYCFDQKSSPFLRPPLTNLRVIKCTTEKSAAIAFEKSRGQLLIANSKYFPLSY